MKPHQLILIAAILLTVPSPTMAQHTIKPILNFTNAPKMPYRLLWPAVVNTGNSIYAINGYAVYSGGYSSNILEFNTVTEKWRTIKHAMGYKAQSEAAYIPATNTTYVFGGVEFGGQLVYRGVQKVDMATGAVTTLKVTNPMASAYGTAIAYKGDIYVFGGTAENKHTLSSTYKFDPATATFTKLADMPEGLETAGAVVNGIIYTFGGYDQFLRRMSTTISAYDIKDNTWKVIGKLPESVSANSVAVYGNLILIIGNYDNESFLGYFNTVTKTFNKVKSNWEGRRSGGAAVIGNKLYVFGGTSRFHVTDGGFKSVQVADLTQLDKTLTANFK